MKKWFFGVGAAIILAALIYAIQKEPYVEPEPSIEEESIADRVLSIENVLPLKQTVLYVGLEGVPQLLTELLDPFGTETDVHIPVFLDRVRWMETLGLDPLLSESWSQAGLDPNKGLYLARIHLTSDYRQFPRSIFFLPVTDSDSVMGMLQKWGLRAGLRSHSVQGIQVLEVEGRIHLVGQRGGYTTLMPVKAGEELGSDSSVVLNYQSFLEDSSPRLADHASTEVALNNESGEYGVFGIFQTSVLREQLSARNQLSPLGDALLKQVPMAGLVSSEKGTALRILASPELDGALKKIFGPPSIPNMAQYVPKTGWAATRISLNLETLLSGVSDCLPVSMGKEKLFLMGLPTVMKFRGIPYDDLLAGLDGHVLVMVPTHLYVDSVRSRPMFRDRFLMIASVRDRESADRFLVGLNDSVLKTSGVELESVHMDDAQGVSWTKGGRSFTLIRKGDAVFYGTHQEDIRTLLGQMGSGSLADTAQGSLLNDATKILVHTMEFTEMTRQWQRAPAFIRVLLKDLAPQTLTVSIRSGLELMLNGDDQGTALLVLSLWLWYG